ncbi:hypothetical protein ACS0TY_003765 [Phlomoides rotata]
MFLSILAHHTKNRIVKLKYTRAGRTVSKYFHKVLNTIIKLHPMLLVRPALIDDECIDNSELDLVLSCCLLHNFIRTYSNVDPIEADYQPDKTDDDADDYVDQVLSNPQSNMWRDQLATSMYKMCRGENVPSMTEIIHCRVWTVSEESMLACVMETIIQEGWKNDNGFNSGYLKLLEKEMKKMDPHSDLRAEPHISSRVHPWKRNHATITSIIDKYGMSWDSIKCQIIDENEDL